MQRFEVPTPRAATTRIHQLLPWGLWVLSVVAEFWTSPDVRLGPVLAAVPALAAASHTWRAVLAFGALSLVTLAAFRWYEPAGHPSLFIVVAAILAGTAAGALSAAGRGREQRRLDELRATVGKVQQAVLRPLPECVAGYQVAGCYRAAGAENKVGGDFYEALNTPHGLRLVIGDVCGKGLPAVDATVTLLGAFREAAFLEEDLACVAHRMDQSLMRRQESTGDARFASALLVQARPDGRLTLVNCGHVPPLHIDPDARVRELELRPGRLLGLGVGAPGLLGTATHELPPGTCLLATTDGITEARDGQRAFFDLAGAVAQHRHTGAHHRMQTLLDELHRHTGGRLNDDAAAIAISTPAAAEAGCSEPWSSTLRAGAERQSGHAQRPGDGAGPRAGRW
ncbi:serine/threonine-protein phosphatase [Streptomyces sp. ISL-66]|uniref:PP2C family protein-serine/threonine phosphatase n=1 Tax=Streptomyces sp. ISL-66 TaxID=2819186 RepID=UPI001BE62B3D|nr:PP2C family protein-serine/threonine phosphatase [Streptomyces sp. ISL-66]MBT2470103.1 serine/threonine-protein phosphatase [Streptomyces sp. ISL-66]